MMRSVGLLRDRNLIERETADKEKDVGDTFWEKGV